MSHLIGHIATVTKITKARGVDRIDRMLTGTVLSEDVVFDYEGNVAGTTLIMSSLTSISASTELGQRLSIDVEED